MPSSEDRSRSLSNQKSQFGPRPLGLLSTENRATTPLTVPEKDQEQETTPLPVQLPNMLPVPYVPPVSGQFSQMSPVQYSPVVTRQLSFHRTDGVTRVLNGIVDEGSQRPPVTIKGGMKRPVPPPPLPYEVHKKRRLFVSLTGVFALLLITSFTLLIATPMGHDIGLGSNPSQNGSQLVSNANNNVGVVAQATATAVYNQRNDGYDPLANGGQTIGNGAGSLSWPIGQCTYWANARYHQLTGFWVSWTGNADQWVAGATAAGWTVSTTPHVPSIIVMMPYYQGASYYGHVAVVESIVPNVTPVTVSTSNMNWYSGDGGWDITSNVDFTVGPGIYFIWHK